MKKTILGLFSATFMLLAFSNATYAQDTKEVTVNSKAVDQSRGANPNIKGEAPATDKVEDKSRGTCSLYFSNYSGLYVKVYVDGYYKGTMSPYGYISVFVGDGYTTYYCISTGGTRDWSGSGDCRSAYRISLYY